MSCQKFICFAVRNGITKQRRPNYLINKLIVLRYRFCVNVILFTEQMYLAEQINNISILSNRGQSSVFKIRY